MTAKDEIKQLIKDIFKPDERLSALDWVSKYVKLTPKQSAQTGSFNHTLTPYWNQLYRDLEDPEIRQITCMKGCQLGWTTFCINAILYWIANQPFNIGYFSPSQELCKSVFERGIEPLIHTTEPVRNYLTGNPDHIRRNEIVFKHLIASFIGGGSASKLSSRPLAKIVVDEIDKLSADRMKSEASPLHLIKDRQVTYLENGLAKLLIGSTPTLAGGSLIESEFENGTKSEYYVPCPHCKHSQVLQFENIDFCSTKKGDAWNEDEILKSAKYKCPKCSGYITNEQRYDMINAGTWVDTVPNKTHKSYHISSLYSLNLTWGLLAVEFLHNKDGGIYGLQNWENSYMGRAFVPMKSTVYDADFDLLIKNSLRYLRGTVPWQDSKCLIMGSDTQQFSHFWTVAAIGPNNELAIVDWGNCLSFQDLETVSKTPYKIFGTENVLYPFTGFIDAGGNRTNDVHSFCASNLNVWYPVFGRGDTLGKIWQPLSKRVVNHNNTLLELYYVKDKHFTDILLTNALKGGTERILLPENVDDEFRKHLLSTSIIAKKNKNGIQTTEYKVKGDNHYFDCVKYLYALKFALMPQLNAAVELEEEQPETSEEQPTFQPTYSAW